MNEKLKLYVWEHVLQDYTDGIMFAFAESEDHARELILKKDKLANLNEELNQKPRCIESSEAFVVWGGA